MRSTVLAISLGLALTTSSCGDDSPVSRGAGPSPDESELADPTAGRKGPLGSDVAISCVESYSPEAVTKRVFAFDGVVIGSGETISDRGDEADLDLSGVTFRVNQWFGEGHGSTFTVDLQVPESAYGIGSRLLVSGESRWGDPGMDDAIAWPCGFTRYYDAATARAWLDAY